MPIVADGAAPYPPHGKVIDLVERHRAQGLPTPISVEKIARLTNTPGLAPRVMKALHLLDLIDKEGMPTPAFDDLAKAPSDTEFKERFAAMVRAAYADVFQYIDPATASHEEIEGQFRSYTPRGQLDRMVALFKGLCEYAGIMPPSSAPVSAKARSATSATSAASKIRAAPLKPKPKPRRERDEKPDETRVRDDPPPPSDAKSRYIDLLLAKAESEPSDELFDRIEKVLGIDAAPKTSAPARGQGDDSEGGE